MATSRLVFEFLGIDAGAGAEFDKMAGKASMLEGGLGKLAKGSALAGAAVAVWSVKMAAQFQKSTELIHTQAGASQAAVDAMRKGILGMAGEVGTAPEQLSEALFHIASTGAKGAAALKELKTAAEGAKIGGADLTDVTNALNATIVSGIKGAGNFSHAMGELNAIVGAGDMHMQDLAEALGSGVLAVVKSFGVNLSQAGAALATFGDNNIRGAQAATYLRQAVQSISDPGAKASAALGKIHLTTGQLTDSLAKGGLTGALDLLHSHFESSGLAANKWGDVMEQAFTKKAGTGITILLEQFGRYQLKQAEINEGGKNFGADWAATTKNLSFQWNRLTSDVEVLAIKLGDDLLPAAMDVIHVFIDTGRAVSDVVGWFGKHEVATAALATVLTAALLPALLKTASTMAVSAWESFALAMMYAKDAVLGMAGAEDDAAASGAALDATNPILLAAAVAVGALTFSWLHSREANAKAKQAVDDYTQSLHTNTNSIASLQTGITQLTAQYAPLLNLHHQLEVAGDHEVAGSLASSGAYKEAVAQLGTYHQQLATVTNNVNKISAAYGINKQQVQALAQANGVDLTGSLTSVDAGFKQIVAAANLSKSPLKDANANFADMAQQTTTASSALTELGTSFDDLVGNFVAMKQAQLDFKSDLHDTVAALKKSHDSITGNSQASIAAGKAYFGLVDQIKTVTTATYTSSKSFDAAKASAQKMLNQLEQLPVKGPAVRRIIAELKHDIAGMGGAALVAGEQTGGNLIAGLTSSLEAGIPKATGAAKQVMEATIHQLHITAQVQSPSRRTMYIGKMLALGLISGWTGEAARIKDMLATSVQDALNNLDTKLDGLLSKQQQKLKAAQSTLDSALKSRNSSISSLAGTIGQGAAVSGIFGTDANGNASMANLGSFLGGQVGPLKQFAQDLALLHKRGLNNNLLNQIAQLGPTQGIQVAEQILSGQDSIAQLNSSSAAIQHYAKNAAKTTEDALYAAELKKDRAAVHDQTVALKDLTREIKHLKTVAGHDTAQHLVVELKNGRLKIDSEDAKEIVKALNKLGHDTGIHVNSGSSGRTAGRFAGRT